MIQTETGPQKLTYAQTKARKQRREITHLVMTDDDAVVVYQLAEERLRKAKARTDKDEIVAAQDAYDAAEEAVRESALVFKLRALPRKGDGSFAALKAEHPPTPENDKKLQQDSGDPKAKAVWNIDTFGPALVAACLIEPQVTVEEATEMATEWNDAEWDGLVWAALSVNQQATNTAGLVFN